jgi:PAS domain S-box-containing protein
VEPLSADREIARLREATAAADRRLERLQTLVRLSGLISSSLDLDAVLREIARAAARLVEAPVVGVWEVDEPARTLEIRAFSDDRFLADYPRRRIGFDESLPGWVAMHRRPVNVEDVFADGRVLAPEWFRAHGLQSAHVVPIIDQDALLGVLALNAPAPFRLGPEDEELLRSFVGQAALAIRNARLYRSSEVGRTRLTALVEVIRGMTRGLDLPLVLQGIAEAAATVFEGEAGIRLLEGDELVWAASTPGAKEAMVYERIPVDDSSVSGRVASTGEPLALSDVFAAPWVRPYHRHAARADRTGALMGLPIREGSRVLGTLLVFRGRGHHFDPDAMRLGMSLADQAGIAIANARLYAETVARQREAEAMSRVTSAVTQSLDLERTLGVIVDQACQLLGTHRAALGILEAEARPDAIRFLAVRGMSAEFSRRMRPRHARDGTTPLAVAGQRPVWSADVLADPALDLAPETREAVRAEGYRAAISVPLVAGDRVTGVLVAYRDAPGPFAPRDVELLQALAGQAAVAIENARLYEASRRRGHEAERIARLARDINGALDIGVILQGVAEAARELTGADIARIALRESGGEALRFRYWAGTGAELDDHLRMERGKGIGGHLIQTHRPFRTDDYAADPRISRDYLAATVARGIVAALAVPIVSGGRVEGAVFVNNRSPRRFTDHDEALLVQLADQAAVAIRNAALLAEAEHRRGVAESLAETSRALAQSLDLQEVARRVVRSIRALLDAETAALCRVDPGSGDLALLASDHRTPTGEDLPGTTAGGTGLAGLAVHERRVVVTTDILGDPRVALAPEVRALVERWGIRAVLAVPLVVQDGVIGVLAIGDGPGRRFDEESIRLSQAFADQAALALDNAALYGAARDARDFLRSLAEHSPAAIVTTDLQGRVSYWSPRAEELFGFRADEVRGRKVGELQRGGEEAARAVARRLREEGRISGHEVDVRTADGRWLECRASLALLRDAHGVVTGMLAILDDASERKRLEAQLRQAQKMEAVGRLAGGVAHDFNNLLAVIMGHGDLAQSALRPGDPLAAHIHAIRRASERAAALTRQLLAFSRRQLLQPKIIDVGELVRNMASMLRRLIGEDVELTLHVEPGAGLVEADPGQVEQVLMNLAVNARDAMPGGGRLTLETGFAALDESFVARRPGASPGPHVRLTVRDTGCGMTPEVLAHLFEPFFTTKEAGQGTGLGLSTVYGIVKQHRGYIDVESEPGRGSAFSIYLPRVEGVPAAPAAATGQEPRPGGRETVLLVEDEDVLRELVAHVLADRGYAVRTARDGVEALALVAEQDLAPDLAVTDVIMPRLSGAELVARLRARRPGLPVLYISGYTADVLRGHTDLGPDDAFLAKPFTPDALLRKVREVLDGARGSR